MTLLNRLRFAIVKKVVFWETGRFYWLIRNNKNTAYLTSFKPNVPAQALTNYVKNICDCVCMHEAAHLAENVVWFKENPAEIKKS